MKGSDKTFGKWFGSNWIWLTVVGVMLSGVAGLGYKIFSTYAATFPYISNDCSGLMKPDTHLGENARPKEVSDDQATPYLYP